MPSGIQIWDSAGNIILDISGRLVKSINVVTVTESGAPTVSVSGQDSSSLVIAGAISNQDGSPVPIITPISGGISIDWGPNARGAGFSREIVVMEL